MSNVRRRAVLTAAGAAGLAVAFPAPHIALAEKPQDEGVRDEASLLANIVGRVAGTSEDRKSTRLNSSHVAISYAVFCLKKKTMIKKGKEVSTQKKRTKT